MSELEALPSNIPGFDIHSLIARGGMAAVYLATQTSLNRQVALKIMDSQKDESFADRFLNEGRLIASLQHPNVITIHDLGRLDDGRVYISMEFIDGGDLEQRLSRPMSVDDAVKILHKLSACLQYVHEHDVIHRDIKPANILFRQDGSLVLTDFGIAKQMDNDIKLTREGDMVGSPGYMSPEQAQANKNIDHRCDIYSVGVIFSEMLLGKNKFAADSYIETSMNHIQMEIPHLDSSLSQYQGILNKMLAKLPHERFSSAKAVNRALDEVNRGGEDPVELSTVKMPKRSFLARFDTVVFVFILMTILGGGAYFFQQTMVETHLEKAGQAYKKNKLLVPKGDNAVYHYRKTLNFEPWNISAQKGLEKVAGRYAKWAENALGKGHLNSARKHLKKGLKADPKNVRLKAVEKRLK